MAIESRASWGARSPRNRTSISSARGVKAHYTGGGVSTQSLTDHAKCRSIVRGIQDFHMDGNGWADIAYSMIACEHAAMIGRGPNVLTAANGPGLNTAHYSILILVGTSGSTALTDNMKRHFHEARDYLRSHGGAGSEIKGHRDGYSTDCPGPNVYPWIHSGAPKPGAEPTPDPAPTPSPTEDDDMTQYFSYGRSNTNPIEPAPGEWTRVTWDTEYADPSGEHSGSGYTMLTGDPSVYHFDGFVQWEGLTAGARVEARLVEALYVPATSTEPAKDETKETGWEGAAVLTESLRSTFSDTGSVSEGRKLILEVRHFGAAGVKIVGGRAKLIAWQ
jgi:hypothetical protein